MKNLLLIGLLAASMSCFGCGGGNGDADASTAMDTPATDAPDDTRGLDAASGDARTASDTPAASDTPTVSDAPATTDAPLGEEDACVPPPCPAPPPGCNYVGGSLCECGRLVCDPVDCEPACARGDYCRFVSGCDGAQTCSLQPEICPSIYMPVCGCDGRTYGNGCEAAAAGASVEHDGECETSTRCVPACEAGFECQACRGPGGGVFVCIPEGAVC